MKVADFEEALKMVKPFMNGKEVTWNDKQLQLKWVRPELPEIEMHVAGYGPKALAVAGRQGDGVIIQLADPDIIQWIMDDGPQGRRGGRARPGGAQVHRQRAEPHLGRPGRRARAGALVPGDGVEPRPGPDRPLRHRRLRRAARCSPTTSQARKFYDYNEHSRVGAKHGEFVTDEICDRFCVLGTAEQAIAKLRELESIGVDQFNIYLMTHGQEETLEAYGRDILPQFSGVTA